MDNRITLLLRCYEQGVITETEMCSDLTDFMSGGKISPSNLKLVVQYRLKKFLSMLLSNNCINLGKKHVEDLTTRAQNMQLDEFVVMFSGTNLYN